MLAVNKGMRGEAPRRLGVAAAAGAAVLVGFLGLLVILERIGLTASFMAPLMVGLALAAFAGAGLVARTMLVAQYDLIGGAMPVAANALALTAMTVGLVIIGRDPLAVGLGAAAGLAFAAWIVGRAMHASKALTLPEHLGKRHGRLVRTLAALIVVTSLFPALVAFIETASAMVARTYGVDPEHAVEIVVAGLILASVFGGMRGISMAQLAAGVTIAIASLTIGAFVAADPTGLAPPALAFGGERLIAALTAFAGVAAFPSVALRLAASPSRPEARRSGCWAAALLLVPVLIIAEAGLDAADTWGGSAVLASLVEAAGVLAMLAGAAGFAFAIAATLTNDIYHALLSPEAAASRRLIVARLILVTVIAVAAAIVALIEVNAAQLVLWSLSLTGAGLLPLVVFGATKLTIRVFPAVAGIAAGLSTAVIELGVGVDFVAGESDAGAGFWGAVAGIIVIVVLMIGAAADRSMRDAPTEAPEAELAEANRAKRPSRRAPSVS